MHPVTRPTTWNGLEELGSGLRRFLARHCSDENEVDDVIQETYLRAARYRTRQEGAPRLCAWARRIALNVLSDRRRRGARFVPIGSEEVLVEERGEVRAEEDAPPLRIGRHELERESALRLLGEARTHQRSEDLRLLDSFYGGAQCCRETARECGVPRHLVKVRLFRARRRLARTIRRLLALRSVPLDVGGAA